jgi:aspartyl-tRNA(Asn)/glutamyl-tRNA(Gln) amidotransferase subunit A
MDLCTLTLYEAAALVQQGKVSPVELVESCLELISREDSLLNCFITLTADLALEQARQAEREIQAGEYRGPLHGIPLALKDIYATAGIRTTYGSQFFTDHIPAKDAAAVQALKAAGAVLLGKQNMHEIALGVTNENLHYGAVRNPWALDRISGGSSGGSAAAVAAGLCFGALGTDTGGSIRIPASLCGVVGLKPTFGRISLRGVMPLSWNLDHAGPITRSIKDAALLLQSMAGYDPSDPYSVDHPVEDYLQELDAGVQGWRIALLVGESLGFALSEVARKVAEAAQVFRQLGAVIEGCTLPELEELAQANGLMVTSDAAAFHHDRLQTTPERFGEDVRQRLMKGASYTSTEYARARHLQSRARRQFDEFFTQYDLLLLPATPVPAPVLYSEDAVMRAPQLTRYTSPFNFTGLPALTLPCGFITQKGVDLPVGLQLVAPPWAERRLLQAGAAYEQATSWHRKKAAFAGREISK